MEANKHTCKQISEHYNINTMYFCFFYYVIKRILLFQYNDHSVRELWDRVLRKYSSLFEDLDVIYPALLHGDLWSGNVSETSDGPGKNIRFTMMINSWDL